MLERETQAERGSLR